MKSQISFLLIVGLLAPLALGQNLFIEKFDAAKMRERVIRLSADDFEGRGPGTDGGQRAARYIADQLKASGVRPANRSSYFQNVPLVGVKADPKTTLNVAGDRGRSATFAFGGDFVGTTGAQSADVSIRSAELVFMGYGIESPLYKWNDYKGDPNQYVGKVLMIMVNDPPSNKAEPNLFGGKALTYYGRWTYKFEEAAKRGAAGVILIHTTESAGYGWNVVRTSNGSWRYEIARTLLDKTPFLQVKSWATNDAASKMLRLANLDLDRLRKKAQNRDFAPVNTGLKIDIDLKSEMKRFNSPNVVGKVQGNDIKLSREYVIYSAHWDHLGIGEPDARGDKIYNGAYDNASGVATVLGIAEVIAKLPKLQRPRRSVLFLFPTAEEQGLLGAEYYSHNPLIPLSKTAANINLDGVNIFGKVSDFMALGAERSTLISSVNDVAAERKMTVKADSRSEQGFFFRSDHFPFAKAGVPSVSLQHGDTFITPLSSGSAGFFKDYNAKYYHQVSDEYREWWDISAMIQEAEIALAIGLKVANAWEMPHFDESDEFASADKLRANKNK